jgi:uncharacterized membrane protein affecting hemolysin expression
MSTTTHYIQFDIPALSLAEASVIFCIRLLSVILTLLKTFNQDINHRKYEQRSRLD